MGCNPILERHRRVVVAALTLTLGVNGPLKFVYIERFNRHRFQIDSLTFLCYSNRKSA